MVPEARLELARLERRGILNPLCLPIPPLGQIGAGNEARTRDPDLGKVVLYQLSYSRLGGLCFTALSNFGAGNETRTRDPDLGKVVLYQLSYCRLLCLKSEEEETRTPTSQLTLPPQSSASTNSATSPTCPITSE